jgi:hypothetical protein
MLQWMCAVRSESEGVAAHLNYVSHTLDVSYSLVCFTLYLHDYWSPRLLCCHVTSQPACWTVPIVNKLWLHDMRTVVTCSLILVNIRIVFDWFICVSKALSTSVVGYGMKDSYLTQLRQHQGSDKVAFCQHYCSCWLWMVYCVEPWMERKED